MQVKKNPFIDSFEIDRKGTAKIEQGGQSRIYIVKDENQKVFVAKVFEQQDLKKENSAFESETKSLQILGKHQYIIRSKFCNKKGNFFDGHHKKVRPYILLEYCKHGCLLDIIQRKVLTEPSARFFFICILEGLNYCHQKSVFHYDIKPDNILIKEKDGKCIVRIADFGLSSQTDSSYYRGSVNYMTPQMILKQKVKGVQADMFGLGVLLFTMLSGLIPFRSASLEDAFYKALIQEPKKFWTKVEQNQIQFSESAKNLVEGMLAFDQEERICSYEQIINHKWLKEEMNTDKKVLEEIVQHQTLYLHIIQKYHNLSLKYFQRYNISI